MIKIYKIYKVIKHKSSLTYIIIFIIIIMKI